MYSPSIQKLLKLFLKFPTVGPRTAARFVFYLIRSPNQEVKELLLAIEDLKKKIKICPLCFRSFEPKENENGLCPICADPRRNKKIICIVERDIDLEAIEKTRKFNGLYFVLGGTLSGFGKNNKKEEVVKKVKTLIARIKKPSKTTKIEEIILALSPTTEGQTMSLWLRRKLQFPHINPAVHKTSEGPKITQLGRGLPVGGELEYADEETLTSALERRE